MSNNNGQSNGKLNGKLPDKAKSELEQKWLKRESDFLNSDMNLTQFSKANELPLPTVYKQAEKRKWLKKRDAIKREDLLAGKADFDGKCKKALDEATQKIADTMPHCEDPKTLANLMKILESVLGCMYRIMDVPLPKQVIEQGEAVKAPATVTMEQIKEAVEEMAMGSETNGQDN